MSEALVPNVALIIRVMIVGGILLALPRITRKGLLFGVYVGEAFADGAAADEVRRSWTRGCLMAMALALVVGFSISVAGWPVTGNLTGTAVLLLACAVLYVRSYSRVRALAPVGAARQAERATVALQDDRTGAEVFAILTFVVCCFAGVATLVYGIVSLQAMPEVVPTLRHALGSGKGMMEKSTLVFLYGPAFNIVLSPFFALLGWLTARAKRSLRERPDRHAAAAQESFRSLYSHALSGTGLFICLLLTVYSVQLIRVGLGSIGSMGTAIWWIGGAMIVYMAGTLISIFTRYGQGAALMEHGYDSGALTGGLADNSNWVLGMFYYDRDDPSIMVEKRFGFGFTLNYGNGYAVLIVGVFSTLVLSLIALGLVTWM